jgi:hypothetical protein
MDSNMQFEIQWREKLLSSLARVLTAYNKQVDAERQEAINRQLEIRALYPTPEEAQDAFGYGDITEDAYRGIVEQLESVASPTILSAARDELKEFISRLRREIKGFEWDALPEAEKERIRQSNDQFKADLKRRKEMIS